MRKIALLLYFTLVTGLVNFSQIRLVEIDPINDIITLRNFGGITTDVSSYWFCARFSYNQLGSLVVESGSLNLAAGATVSFSGKALNNTSSDLALYSTPSFTSSVAMLDFAQWGAAGIGRESVAETKGIWTAGTFISIASPYEYIGDGSQNGVNFWASLCVNTASNISRTACDSYTVPSGNATHTVSGTYQDVIPNAAGCDSVITINLTINNSSASTFSVTTCDSYTVPSGNATHTVSGTYQDVIPNAVGCDSAISINLTINNSSASTFSVTTCDSYTVPSGNATHTVSGTYQDVIPNAADCDSVITINLTINNSSASTFSVTTCDSYTVPSGNATHTVSGTYQDVIPNAAGCDSVITINLTINNSSASTFSVTACDSYTVPSGNATHTVSGTYQDVIPNAAGCDSVITINLTINNSSASIFSVTACDGYTVPSGNTIHTVSGTYQDVIPNAAGCDSVITINLTINNSSASTFSVTACDSYTVPSGNATHTVSGTYQDIIPNSVGCDSALTINLTINNSSASTFSVTTCDSYTVPSGNAIHTVSGTYQDVIPNAVGCDSALTINLTINNSSASTFSVTACGSYTVPSGNATHTVSGTYQDVIPNAVGCDSALTINLTINNSSVSTFSFTACISYTVPSGDETYTVSGTYLDTILNVLGCDSIMTIVLTISDVMVSEIEVTACNSYRVPSGDETYTVSGVYMDTIQSVEGCDSIITINLTISDVMLSSFDVTACDDYTVPSGDETYSVSDVYMDTIQSVAGCDSIMTINLTINKSSTSVLNVFECDSYTVPSGDETYTVGGNYLDTVPNAVGCDSLIFINLTINNSSVSTFSVTTCDSYTVPSGIATHTVSGTYQDVIPNAVGCDSVLIINLTINNRSASTFSVTACDSYTVPSGNATHNVSGTYQDVIPNAAGCDSVITINLTINNSSASTFSVTACDSYTVPSGNATQTVSGTYQDIIPNSVGCDSALTINLTINNSSASTFSVTACDSYTVPSGNATYTVSGTYQDIIPNAVGCDSALTINLTINNSSASTFSVSACDTYRVPSGNATHTVSGTYQDVIPNSVGCDSALTINLTINNSSASTFSVTACDSYRVPSGNATHMVSGTYQDVIPNAVGCDSTLTINLTINNSSASTISVTICDSYTVPSGNATHTVSGTYQDVIPNSVGCDSVLTINLTINNSSASTISVTACDSYTVPSGNATHIVSGTYQDVIPNATGCDSLITINLEIVTIDISVISELASLTANATNASFQWLDCANDNLPLTGALNKIFLPNSSGVYAVQITKNGCKDTSDCFPVVISSISNGLTQNKVEVFPNPTTGKVNIVLGENITIVEVEIRNMLGQIVKRISNLNKESIKIDGEPGFYFITVLTSNNEMSFFKIRKE